MNFDGVKFLNPLKVGLLTLAALASVVIMSLKITTNKYGFGEYVTYKTVLKDASGIFEKSSIKVAGINAGRIKSIELHGSEGALLTFEMLEGIKLTNNSRLKIKSVFTILIKIHLNFCMSKILLYLCPIILKMK